MAEETNKPVGSQPSAEPKAKPAAKAAKAKKEKPPAIEDKPFTEFIEQHFTPALKKALSDQGIEDINLTFTKQGLPIAGADSNQQCWQVVGNWQDGQRQFNLYFLDLYGRHADEKRKDE